ncbi:MAG: hypothetical protein QGF36_03675 [Candidatus Marinimicrobia bacterium]|jgi:cytochrome oxidase Cu insertion factor (SCO1/SenC/PrrC family)|nr:hypothetical protein [Candidatus Neomarinimicrobiota bacterium]MDP6853392.1 hypothetical protein [Candidatus Neomarinimicrobiota bacterium]MDP6936514.1 hypothetical protein [Candidatus Neomarinimicrobiota bacterium]
MNPRIKDILLWIGLLSLGAAVGVLILLRDVEYGFGTVTFGKVPEFTLEDSQGRNISLQDFSHKVWIGSFIHSDCEDDRKCENLNEITTSLFEELNKESGVELVSISMQLNQELYPASPKHTGWTFLTGSGEKIKKLVKGCYQTPELTTPFNTLYFLVDQNSIIRGYYDSQNIKDVKKLIRDSKKLV